MFPDRSVTYLPGLYRTPHNKDLQRTGAHLAAAPQAPALLQSNPLDGRESEGFPIRATVPTRFSREQRNVYLAGCPHGVSGRAGSNRLLILAMDGASPS